MESIYFLFLDSEFSMTVPLSATGLGFFWSIIVLI